MIKHLYYKEWLKTRWYAILSLIVGLGISIYIFINVDAGIRSRGNTSFILSILYGYPQNIYYALFEFVPFITALAIGLSQFIPEVTDKRIKLTLHLPMHVTKSVFQMVLFGIGLYLIIVGIPFAYIEFKSIQLFPSNVTIPATHSMLAWILGGMTTYFMIVMIAMEPVLKYKFLYVIVVYFLIGFFRVGESVGDIKSMLPGLFLIMAVASVSVLFTSHRFNKGEN